MENNQYVLFPIPKEELFEMIGKIIDQRLEKFFEKTKPSKESDELLTIDQASDFLKISKQTIYGHSSKSLIPCMKKGRKLFFSKSELIEWIRQGKKKTLTEIEKEIEESTSKK